MITASESDEERRERPASEASSRCGVAKTSHHLSRIHHTHRWWKWRTSTPDACLLRKIPVFILAISLVEAVVFYAADDRLRRILVYDAENRRQLWRFLSYMLVHTDEVHLGLNVVIQGFVGTPVEVEQGRVRCALIYFGGGLAGSLGTCAFGGFSLLGGASGGVYALLTAQIPNVALNYGTIKYATHRIATVTTLSAADVAYIFFRVHFYNNERPRIGWVAHASGAAAGVLLGFLVLRGTSKWKKKFRTASCALLALPLLSVLFLSFIPSSPDPSP